MPNDILTLNAVFKEIYKNPSRFFVVPNFRGTLKGKTLRLEIREDSYYIYCDEVLVNIFYKEWNNKKNPKFKVLELLYEP